MKTLIAAVCLLVLNVVAVSSAGASGGGLNDANALTSEEARFVFGEAQAPAIMPLSGEEMASTRGNSTCIDVVNGNKVYVYCSPPFPLAFVTPH